MSDKCPKCDVQMQPGKAMISTLTDGIPDFQGTNGVITVSPGGPGKLIDCSKCPGCGFSRTYSDALRTKESGDG